MARNILIGLLVLSFCFLGFTIGRYTEVGPAGQNLAWAKEIPDLSKSSEIERAMTMAIIANSNKMAKGLLNSLDSSNLSTDAYKVFVKAAKGIKPIGGQRNQPDPNKVYKINYNDAPVKGNKDAPVTIIEISEFQCPFCGRAAKTMKQIEEKYGDKVKFVFMSRLLPRHSKAPLAHAAAYSAGHQGKFWEMHDKIFANQGAGLTEENYLKYAGELGLNVSKFTKDMKDPNISKEWADDMAEGDRHGVRSTPTFFINGKMVRGAKPLEAFTTVIDAALKTAEK